jgi:hypothetical protein
VVVSATLDNVGNGLAVDLQVGGKVPAEVRHSDHNEMATCLSRGVDYRDCKEEDENQKKSAGIAGQGPHEFVVARLLSRAHALNAPERAVRAELGYFAGGTFADVNSDGNDTDKRAHENHRHKKRRDVPDAQRSIKRYDIVDRRGGVQKNLRQPCDQNQDEDEHVIPFHPAANRFQFGDFKAGQN